MKSCKKIILLSVIALLAASCVKSDVFFDPNLLLGKWVNGTEYYRYDNDSTGVTWDVADNVTEEEAQAFKWEYNPYDKSLTLIHWMEMTQNWTVPRVYTLSVLNDSNLVYMDKFGKQYSFKRTI